MTARFLVKLLCIHKSHVLQCNKRCILFVCVIFDFGFFVLRSISLPHLFAFPRSLVRSYLTRSLLFCPFISLSSFLSPFYPSSVLSHLFLISFSWQPVKDPPILCSLARLRKTLHLLSFVQYLPLHFFIGAATHIHTHIYLLY